MTECNCPLADDGPNLIDCQNLPNCAIEQREEPPPRTPKLGITGLHLP